MRVGEGEGCLRHVISLLNAGNELGHVAVFQWASENDGHLCHLSSSAAASLIAQFRSRIAVVLPCLFIINFIVKPRSISIIVNLETGAS